MDVWELRAAGAALLDQAARIRDAFPDRAAMGRVAVADVPMIEAGALAAVAAAHKALRVLRAVLLVVRAGIASTTAVLDAEAMNAELAIARLTDPAAAEADRGLRWTG